MEYKALGDDGVVALGIPRKTSAPEYKIVLRTFLSVFPNATLWNNGRMLIATKVPLALDRTEIEAKLRLPQLHESAHSSGLDSFQTLLSLYNAGPEEIRRYAGEGPILTDDRPMAEYYLSLPEGSGKPNLEEFTGDVMRHVKQ